MIIGNILFITSLFCMPIIGQESIYAVNSLNLISIYNYDKLYHNITVTSQQIEFLSYYKMAYSVGKTLFILDLKTKLTSEQQFDHDHDIFLIRSFNETHFYTVDQSLVISFYSLGGHLISKITDFDYSYNRLDLADMSPDCCLFASYDKLFFFEIYKICNLKIIHSSKKYINRIYSIKFLNNSHIVLAFASSIEIHDVIKRQLKTQMDFDSISFAYMTHNNNFLLSDREGNFIEISNYKYKVREYISSKLTFGIEYVDKSLVIGFIDICVVLWNILPEEWLFTLICGFESISLIKHQKYRGNENFYDEKEILIKVNGKSIPKFDSFDDLESDQAANLLTSKIDMVDCLSNCSNNGKCILKNNKLQCECDSFYIGPSCETDVRPCSSNPCLNNSTCKNQMSERKYLCECQKDTQSNNYLYYGFSCENKVDVCKNETCSTKGNCVDIDNKPKCKCFYLYSGNHCEIESQTQKKIKNAIKTSSIIAIIFIVAIFLFFIVLDFSNLFIGKKFKKSNSN